MDISKLVVGQKVWLRCGDYLGEPTESHEATVTEFFDEGDELCVALQLELDDGKWGVVFKNGEQWGGIWILNEATGKVRGEWDRRFKVVFEEGEHTKPHKFAKDQERKR